MEFEQLKLSNQLCFPVYAASRLITKAYQPHLNKLGITYPQYLVLMVLWEFEQQSVNEIANKLILNTNTITPLLQRMEKMDLIERVKDIHDERKVWVKLTHKGEQLKTEAATIPYELVQGLENDALNLEQIVGLRNQLNVLVDYLKNKQL